MRTSRASVALVSALGLLVSCTPAAAPRVGETAPLACPHDAVRAPKGDGCACLPGLALLDGACVGESDVATYCGAPASGGSAFGACEAPVCAPGDAIDLARSRCVPFLSVRALAAEERSIPDGMMAGCHDGSALAVRGSHLACLPYADLCPRDTAWDAIRARCLPSPACQPGALRAGTCVPLVTRAANGASLVDVGRWTRAMLGADGGEGSPRLCAPLRQRPWDFDVSPGGARTVALSVELVFPDNDVTQLTLRVQALDAATGTPLGGEAPAATEGSLTSLLVPLRALGGSADAASATLRVTCVIRGGSSPLALPR